jgi:hypothetical protein
LPHKIAKRGFYGSAEPKTGGSNAVFLSSQSKETLSGALVMPDSSSNKERKWCAEPELRRFDAIVRLKIGSQKSLLRETSQILRFTLLR